MIVARGTSDDKVSVGLKIRRQMNTMMISETPSRTASNFARAELVSFTLATRAFRSL
jgi:hypothetical protein